MTISTAAAPLSYAGNGSTTDFAITWIYIAKSHVVATLRDATGVETLQILDTDYTLTDPGDTGTLGMTNAPLTNETLVITSEPPNTQETDIPLGGSFPARSVEDALDLASQVSNKVDAKIDRSLIVPKTDLLSAGDLEIPNETARALRFLSFDSDGKPIVTAVAPIGGAIVTPFAETYLDDTTDTATRATLGVPGLTVNNALSGVQTYTGLAPLKFDGAVAGGDAITVSVVEPTGNRTLIIPDADANLLYARLATSILQGANFLPRPFVRGCNITPAGGITTMAIGGGQVVDSTQAKMFVINPLGKTTSAWAVGDNQGGLDTGTIAADTTYHIFAIIRNDTGVTDYLFSLSATAPSLPTDYDLFKRIGSWRTDASSDWYKGSSQGEFFYWGFDLSAIIIHVDNPGTSAVTEAMFLPLGVILYWIGAITAHNFNGGSSTWLSPLDVTDMAASLAIATVQNTGFASLNTYASTYVNGIKTNTSAAIRHRSSSSGTNHDLDFITIGWRDPRDD